jgi:trehalose 6-phosphate synthase/phosphatase
VQDYHFMLLPKLIRDRLPKATIGFFLHIPFPSYEVYRLLPWRREILEGLLGANLVGFHTHDYVWHFLNSTRNLLGYSTSMGWITTPDHVSKADVFPIGIGYEHYSSMAKSAEVGAEVKKFREKLGARKVIVSVDRLDYSKGIPNRLEAYGLFLEKHPEYREKVVFILVIGPSRIKVQRYAELKQQIEEMVGTINGRFGTIGWTPLEYLYSPIPYHALLGLYKMADVCPITPVRDGMNLVAKEYLATKIDGKGVLILSETTGAARELGDAIIINPNNIEEIAQAFADALAMPEKEQIERNRAMQERVKLYDISRWAGDFIGKLQETEKAELGTVPEPMSAKAKNELISQFQKARKRLFLLDYDGTLVPFAKTPEAAKPDAGLLKLLAALNDSAKNEVVLISGRDKKTLGQWFGSLKTGMVAEHGVWMKAKGGDWGMMTGLSDKWKAEARAIMKLAVDRIEGSLIEEKDYSLAWHYRKADPRISERHIREIVNDLLNLTANSNLKVLEGSKVVEVKSANLNKGSTAQQWLSRQDWDFVLAIGDDVTDEDLFQALPENAWSIKVRPGISTARFSLDSPDEVRALLGELVVK